MRRFKKFQQKRKLADVDPDEDGKFHFQSQSNIVSLTSRALREARDKPKPNEFLGTPALIRPVHFWCRDIVTHPIAEWSILTAILVNCVCLAIDNPTWTKEEYPILIYTNILEQIFNVFFVVEASFKLIGFGIWFPETGYFRSGWNVMDFIIVAASFMTFAESLSSLRMLRVLRPLRLSNRLPELKVLVTTVIRSITALVDVSLVLFFFFMIFGIIGVQLWSGLLHNRCYMEQFNPLSNQTEWIMHPHEIFCRTNNDDSCPGDWTCQPFGPNPTSDLISFDHLFYAFGTIFEGMSLVDWTKTMYWVADTWEFGWYCAPYFILMVFLISFFSLNLVLVVIANTFEEEKDKAVRAMHERNRKKALHKAVSELEELKTQAEAKKLPLVKTSVIELTPLPEDGVSGNNEKKGGSSMSTAHLITVHADPSLAPSYADQDDAKTEKPPLMRPSSDSSGSFISPHGRHTSFNDLNLQLGIEESSSSDSDFDVADLGIDINNLAEENQKILKRVLESRNSSPHDVDEKDDVTRRSSSDISDNGRRSIQLDKSSVLHTVKIKGGHTLVGDGKIQKRPSIAMKDAALHIEQELELRKAISSTNVVTKREIQAAKKEVALREKLEYIHHLEASADDVVGLDGLLNIEDTARTQLDFYINYHARIFDYHKKSPQFVTLFYNFVETTLFKRTVITAVILNTLVLALYHHNMDEKLENTLDILNNVFSGFFIFEIVVELIAYSPKGYFQSYWNIFDTCVVVVSMIEYVVLNVGDTNSDSTEHSPLTAFRAMRLIKIFRVFRNWQSLRVLLRTVVSSFKSVGYMSLLFFMAVFSFAVLGMQIFAGKYENLENRHRSGFDDLFMAVFTCFQLMTGDDWVNVMRSGVAATSQWSRIFFYGHSILGSYIITNLFIAILLENFSSQGPGSASWEEDDVGRMADKIVTNAHGSPDIESAVLAIRNDILQTRFKNQQEYRKLKAAAIAYKLEEIEDPRCEGLALGCFPHDHWFRHSIWRLCCSTAFNYFIMLIIIVNCVMLAMKNPDVADNSIIGQLIFYSDFCFAYVFLVEAILKLIAFGGWRHHHAYFRSPMNCIDFFICIVSIAVVHIPGVWWLRPFRAVRPVRVVAHSREIRVVIRSIILTLPRILYVMIFVAIFWIAFAIMGVALFGGKFYSCTDTSVLEQVNCVGEFEHPFYHKMTGEAMIEMRPREWINAPMHFDNVFAAYLALFQCATLSGWADISYMAADSVRVGHAPVPGNDPPMQIFFMIFVLLCAWFNMNLFIGTFIDNFNRLKLQFDGSAFMTAKQQEKRNTADLRSKVRLKVYFEPPTNSDFRRKCFYIIMHPWFEPMVMAGIMANVLLMSLTFYQMPREFELFLDYGNLLFALLFCVELILKISGLTFPRFWKFGWNRFDFVVVLSSLIGPFTGLGVAASVVRILRIGRLLRLVRRSENLEKMLNTLRLSLYSLLNVAALLFLVFFIFGVLGVEIYGDVRVSDGTFIGLSKDANFQNFGFAFLAVFRMATGDAWHEIFYGAQIQEPLCDDAADNCGTPYAYLFFNPFMIIGSLVMVNLYIAVILEHFGQQATVELQLAFAQLRRWAKHWNHYDPDGSHYVTMNDFLLIMHRSHIPFGFNVSSEQRKISKAQKMQFFIEVSPVIHMKDTSMGDFSKQNTCRHNDGKGFELADARREYRAALVETVWKRNIVKNQHSAHANHDEAHVMADLQRSFKAADDYKKNNSQYEWCVDFDSTLRMLANKLAGLDVVNPLMHGVLTVAEWYAAQRIQIFWMQYRTRKVRKQDEKPPVEHVTANRFLTIVHTVEGKLNQIADTMEHSDLSKSERLNVAHMLRHESSRLRPLFQVSSKTIKMVGEKRKRAMEVQIHKHAEGKADIDSTEDLSNSDEDNDGALTHQSSVVDLFSDLDVDLAVSDVAEGLKNTKLLPVQTVSESPVTMGEVVINADGKRSETPDSKKSFSKPKPLVPRFSGPSGLPRPKSRTSKSILNFKAGGRSDGGNATGFAKDKSQSKALVHTLQRRREALKRFSRTDLDTGNIDEVASDALLETLFMPQLQ